MCLLGEIISFRHQITFLVDIKRQINVVSTISMSISNKHISILLKEPFALKNSETVYLTIIFSTLSYSDIALIDNFDLIFFYFYFVFEIFGNNSVSIP